MADFDPQEYITPAQAARLKGVSVQWILSLIKREKLKSIEIAGRKFVRQADVLNYERGKPGAPRKDARKVSKK